MNLKTETIKVLEEHGKKIDDIVAVCGDDFKVPVEDFLKFSDTEYDSGYGAQEVASDLKIIGKDFIMVREEYDGSESWVYISTIPPEKTESVSCFTVRQAQKLRLWNTYDNCLADSHFVYCYCTLKEYKEAADGKR